MQFVHLHLHSEYSVLDGLGKIRDYIAKAMENDMPAMALTDHGNMFGVKEFFNEVRKAEKTTGKSLKPIIGCEVYFNPEGRKTKRGREDQSANHLILLAKNKEGYHNLIKIVSIGYTEGFYYKPKIDREVLEKYHNNLICMSACLAGEIPQQILHGDLAAAESTARWFKNLFGEDYYFEIQNHRTEVPGQSDEVFECQQRVNRELYRLGEKLGIKCVATNDCHFVNKEDGPAHDRLICLTTNTLVSQEKRLRYTQQEYMKTAAEMAEINFGHPEVIENTLEVASKVERYDIDSSHILPEFPLPAPFSDSNDYLRHVVYEGAVERYQSITDDLKQRIDFELETIKKMGFPDYFLIVWDYVAAARREGIWVGPGRGSAAGSVVAYCLKITNIDPLRYNLLFERFLNPDRISMPDIDIDFEEELRSKVYEYVEKKYGKDHVSHVITFGTMATKSAIRDVARIEDLPLDIANALAKMIPTRFPDEEVKERDEKGNIITEMRPVEVNFKTCLSKIPELKEKYDNSDNPLVKSTLHYAEKLEGTVRNTGVHACAVIIGRDNLTEHIPISIAKDTDTKEDILVSQYEGSYIEEVGMLKMDFLGLRTLSILKETLRNIKERRGEDIDLEKIPLDDKKTFELFSRGETVSTFQFESTGMQKWLKELKPNRFEDLIAMNALYRPGPMQYIPNFVNRKNGREKIEYEIPEMQEILSDTYGITVYQEQVMLLSQKLAGFTKGQADALRKAMGKKHVEEMLSLEEKFLQGGEAKGYRREKLQKIWKDWKEFAKYAFNKSHATCYALLGYQTAYLKAHYPAEFMAANLTKNLGRIDEIAKIMDECKRMGIKVLRPDVNKSGINFTVTGDREIRFGLAAIKGMGTAVARSITEGAPYKDIFDFMERGGNGGSDGSVNLLNRKVLEALIYAGAFEDAFPNIRRDQYFEGKSKEEDFVVSLLKFGQNFSEKGDEGSSLFAADDAGFQVLTPEIPSPSGEYKKLEYLNHEKELLGIYLSSHPLDEYKFEIENFANSSIREIKEILEKPASQVKATESERFLYVGGMIASISKKVSQKTGRPFATMMFEDFTETMEFALFGKEYERFINYLENSNILFLKLKIKPKYSDKSTLECRIEDIMYLANVKEKLLTGLAIRIPIDKITEKFRGEFTELLKGDKGEHTCPVTLQITALDKDISLDYATKIRVAVSNKLQERLGEMGLEYKGIFKAGSF